MKYLNDDIFNLNINKRINKDINDLEIITPIECLSYPNFYYYPKNKDIIVSKNGEVIRLSNNKLLRYVYIATENSYIQYNNINEIDGSSVPLHRILAYTFIGRPKRHLSIDKDNLIVNHIDGIKVNNSISNLEWCNNSENIKHAAEHLTSLAHVSILAKHMYTGEELVFRTAKECGTYFNISPALITTHIGKNRIHKGHINFYKIKINDDSPWPEFIYDTMYQIGDGQGLRGGVYAKNIDTGKITTFNSITKCEETFNMYNGSLSRHLRKEDPFKGYKNNHIFKHVNDSCIWITYPKELMYEIGNGNNCNHGIPIILENKLTGINTPYSTIREVSKAINVSEYIINKCFINSDSPTIGMYILHKYSNDFFVKAAELKTLTV